MERRRAPGGKMKPSLKYGFGIVLRLVLGAMFVYASYYKIMSPGAFAHQIYNYKLLPIWAINPIALTLPWLQFLCGLALIFNRGALAASLIITGMLLVFQVALFSALLRGLNISCGCFKSGGAPATWLTLGRDFLLVILSGLVSWHLWRKEKAKGL